MNNRCDTCIDGMLDDFGWCTEAVADDLAEVEACRASAQVYWEKGRYSKFMEVLEFVMEGRDCPHPVVKPAYDELYAELSSWT